MAFTPEQLEARYFTASEHENVVRLRTRIVQLAEEIEDSVPDGRQKSICFTLLEELQMRANRAVFAPKEWR
jgi:hypothetical protein